MADRVKSRASEISGKSTFAKMKAHMLATLQHESRPGSGGLVGGLSLQTLPKRTTWWDEGSNIPRDMADRISRETQDRHLREALDYGQSASRLYRPANKPLEDYSDAELVMEMIRRGYAAMKLPSDGGPPEVLRNAD